MHQPTDGDWSNVKRIVRYLLGTIEQGITMKRCANFSSSSISFADSGYAGDKLTMRSTSGYVVYAAGNIVAWPSKRQKSATLSTMEAEYVAGTSAAQEVLYVRQLIAEMLAISTSSLQSSLIFQDNPGAVLLARDPTSHTRAKHISTRYHFVRELQEEKAVLFKHIPGTQNPRRPTDQGTLPASAPASRATSSWS